MKLLTTSLREKLLANGRANRDADGLPREHGYIDHKPVVKLFTPDAGCTWLLTEIDPDDPDRRLRPVRSRLRLSRTRLRQPVRTCFRARQAGPADRARVSFHANQDAIRLRRRGTGARRDQSVRCVMNDQHSTAAPLSEMTRRYIWLLSRAARRQSVLERAALALADGGQCHDCQSRRGRVVTRPPTLRAPARYRGCAAGIPA